jgi:hypothetical protein
MAIPLGILCVLALAAAALTFLHCFPPSPWLLTWAGAFAISRAVMAPRNGSEARGFGGGSARSGGSAGRDRLPACSRPGLNLTTGSQVLRLHRHGETAENIARVLEVRRQQVDLLLKVHGIVMKAI